MKGRVLSDLADINPPTSTVHLMPESEVSFVPMSDVDEEGRWRRRQTRLRRDIGPGYTPFQDGDVLVAKITPCLENGKGAHVHGLVGGVGFGSTEFHVLRAKPGVDPSFLFQITQDVRFRLRAASQMEGSAGQRRVPSRFFHEFGVPDLTTEEQALAGRVLDEADIAIERTRALIAKHRRLHTGLTHALLTRGLDADGRIRSEATHAFKDSPLGRIPEEWEVSNLASRKPADRAHLKTGPFGSSLKVSDWTDDGVPVVTIGSLGDGEFIREELFYVSLDKAKVFSAYALMATDLVFSRVADVGRCVLVTEDEEGWIMSSNMMRLSIDDRAASAKYLLLNITSNPGIRQQIRRLVNAGGRDVANQEILNGIAFPWPSKPEQDRITSVIEVHRAGERVLSVELGKLIRLKAGLMQSLLSGAVRVPLTPAAP